MRLHPLKLLTLSSLSLLFLNQLALVFLLQQESAWLIASLAAAPLLLPLYGLIGDRRYTYKWVGFLTLFYLAIGVSEAFSNPTLRIYGVLNIAASCLMFVSSIYYSRYLR